VKKKTIFIIYSELGFGRIQQKIIDVISYLSKHKPDYRIILCLQEPNGIFLKKIDKHVEIFSPKAKSNTFLFFLKLIKKIYKERPQIIFSFLEKYSFIAILMSKFIKNHPQVIIGQDVTFTKIIKKHRYQKIKKILIKLLYHHAKRILVQTKIQKDDLLTLSKKLSKNIIVSPNWLPLSYNHSFGQIPRDIDILYLGRLDTQKNLFKFIDIIKQLAIKNHNIKAVIVGNGDQKILLKKYIQQKKLLSNIKIFPATINPQQYYLRSKIYLLTSDYEGFPLTVLESIASGCYPVIHNLAEIKTFFNFQTQKILFTNNSEAIKIINSVLNQKSQTRTITSYYKKKIFYQQQKNIKKYIQNIFE